MHVQGQGFESTGGGIQLMMVQHFISQPFIITLPSSQYDLNHVDRDIKCQILKHFSHGVPFLCLRGLDMILQIEFLPL